MTIDAPLRETAAERRPSGADRRRRSEGVHGHQTHWSRSNESLFNPLMAGV